MRSSFPRFGVGRVVLVPGLLGMLAFAGCDASSTRHEGASDAARSLDAESPAAEAAADQNVESALPEAAADGFASDAGERADDADALPPATDGGNQTSCGNAVGGGPTSSTTMHLDIGVHDPSMIWDGNRYYLFATGGALGIRSSVDMQTWTGGGAVLASVPAWIATTLGAAPADLWAPDVSYFAGRFHVYYAASKFGSNNSVIGLATNTTLSSTNPSYAWVDQGAVLRTMPSDDFNAIDPNVSFDESCVPWLAFGSFWSGIKLRKLDPLSGKLAVDDTTLYSIASRNGGAIEAASIVSHNGYYYLFVSFDSCCKGTASTYRTMLGRSRRITGPYVDKTGTDMMQGAAEQVLATSGRYIGPGGGTAWRDGSTYLYVFHYYDGQANGASKLQVRPIQFGADDWVTLQAPLFP